MVCACLVTIPVIEPVGLQASGISVNRIYGNLNQLDHWTQACLYLNLTSSWIASEVKEAWKLEARSIFLDHLSLFLSPSYFSSSSLSSFMSPLLLFSFSNSITRTFLFLSPTDCAVIQHCATTFFKADHNFFQRNSKPLRNRRVL